MNAPVRASNAPVPPFIDALRLRRVQLGLSQEELAERLGWKRNRLREYEIGLRPILPRLLVRWAAEIGLGIVALPTGDGAP